MATEYKGHCLCGNITYSFHSPTKKINTAICHCDMCQRLGGSPYSLLIATSKDDLKVTGPIQKFTTTASSGHKHFCGECGSQIFREHESMAPTIFILAGSLDEESKKELQAPGLEVWAQTKLPFDSLSAPTSFPGNPQSNNDNNDKKEDKQKEAHEYKGHCLCGNITYSFHSQTKEINTAICHCDMCQRLGGSPYSLLIGASKDDLKVTGPIQKFTTSSGMKTYKHFCGDCGSQIFREHESMAPTVFILAGSLDEEAKKELQTPGLEVWSQNKLPFNSLSAPTSFPGNPQSNDDNNKKEGGEEKPNEYKGHCLCGNITYSFHSPTKEINTAICHCDMCQRLGGSPYSLLIGTSNNDLKVTGPIQKFTTTASSGKKTHKHFCGDCGSQIFREHESMAPIVFILAGSLDEEAKKELKSPGLEVWSQTKLPFDTLSALTSFPGNPQANNDNNDNKKEGAEVQKEIANEYSGHCLCGTITYSFHSPTKEINTAICHCDMCQRLGGSPYSLLIGTSKDDLKINGPIQKFTTTASSGKKTHKHFCGECGSQIFREHESMAPTIFILAGSLDEKSKKELKTPGLEVWSQTKLPFDTLSAPTSFPGNPQSNHDNNNIKKEGAVHVERKKKRRTFISKLASLFSRRK